MNPQTLAVTILAVLVLAGGVSLLAYHQGRSDGAAAVRGEQAQSLAELQRQANMAEQRYATVRPILDQLAATVGRLVTYTPPEPKILIREVPTHAPVDTCPDRSPEFRLQYNAIAAGLPAEAAAAAGMPPPR